MDFSVNAEINHTYKNREWPEYNADSWLGLRSVPLPPGHSMDTVDPALFSSPDNATHQEFVLNMSQRNINQSFDYPNQLDQTRQNHSPFFFSPETQETAQPAQPIFHENRHLERPLAKVITVINTPLTNDLNKQQEIKNLAFSCIQCKKTFTQLVGLKNHLEKQHQYNESQINDLRLGRNKMNKDFPCPSQPCTSGYTHRKDIIRHIRYEHGEDAQLQKIADKIQEEGKKLFCCPAKNCESNYSEIKFLRVHIKRIHSRQQADLLSIPIDQIRRQAPLFCYYEDCKVHFFYEWRLKRHIELKH